MLDLFVAADLAVKGTRAVAWSALPDAPVLAPETPRERLPLRARAGLAARLHRVATALEPRPRTDRTSAACS
jgi:hypothetical protein